MKTSVGFVTKNNINCKYIIIILWFKVIEIVYLSNREQDK